MPELCYGLIGAGMMGQEHIRNIALLDGARVVAIADPDAGMRAASAELAGGGCRTFPDHRDLVSADLCDAYVIAAPNDLHHPILLDVLATAKPILCEKPLCTTTRDAADIMRRAAHRAAPVWVAMEYRYMPPVARLLEMVRAGETGTPRMMAIREHRFPFLDKVGHWNRFSLRTGGTLIEKCCHFWDLMRLGLGADPIRVYASAGQDVNHLDECYRGRRPDMVDNAFVIVDFEGGARGMLDLCMFAEGSHWQESIAITGDRARIEARVPGPARLSASGEERAAEVAVADRGQRIETRQEVAVDRRILRAGDHHGATYFQHERFRRLAASGSGAPDVSLTDGYWAVLLGEAAEESAHTGAPVDLRGKGPWRFPQTSPQGSF